VVSCATTKLNSRPNPVSTKAQKKLLADIRIRLVVRVLKKPSHTCEIKEVEIKVKSGQNCTEDWSLWAME